MLPFFTNPENRARLYFLWIAVGCVVLGGGTALGLRIYRPWIQERLTQEARTALARGDFPVASLNARRALQNSPDDARVLRLMAEIFEKGGNPDAVGWCGRVADLSPGSGEAHLEWARVAVKFQKFALAERALAGVPEDDRLRIAYSTTAGQVAFEAGRLAEAERHFAAAVQRAPENPAHHLAHGRVQVLSSDFFTRDAGRTELRELAEQPAYAAPALRALIASYEASQELAAALREGERLLTLPAHTFFDALNRLKLLRQTQDERFPAVLAALQAEAVKTPMNAGALIVWMGGAGLAQEALDWATQREPKLGRVAELRQAIAGCRLTLRDWPAVMNLTADPWRQAEYVRHAYRSEALRARGDLQLARAEWNLATTAAQHSPSAIQWLAKVAAQADWTDASEQTLWMAVGNVPNPAWAVDQLGRRFHEQKNSESLHRLAAKYLATDPQNENLRNDHAFLSVLLGKDAERALIVASDLARKHPENAAYTSTYAVALHLARRSAEALAVLEKLPPEELVKPPIAAHYGVILVANGRPEDARRYLRLGRLAPLLAEEVALVDRAAASIPGDDPPGQ